MIIFFKMLKEKKLLGYIVASLLMLISIFLSFRTYNYQTNGFFGHFKKTNYVTLSPTLITTIIAILIYSAIIIRNFKKYYSEIPKLVLSIINILFLAGFLSVFLGEKVTILGLDTRALLFAGILMSWLGIRSITGYIWIILVLLGTTRMSEVDKAMGSMGVIYIMCAYLSIVVQIIFCKMFEIDLATLKEDLFGIQESAINDVKVAGELTKSAYKNVKSGVKYIVDKVDLKKLFLE